MVRTAMSQRGERLYTCVVCGAQKGKANRWWLAVTGYAGGITFLPWTEIPPDHETVQDLCGYECACKALGRWASTRI